MSDFEKTGSISLTRHLIEEQRADRISADLRLLIEVVARACKSISVSVGKGALGGVLGDAGSGNIQGEAQKKLDVIANDVLLEANAWGGHLAACASEEMDHCQPIPDVYPRGNYLLLFDPLDGSSNIDVNVSVGTIFSVLRCPEGVTHPEDAHFLQPGTTQVAAGYCIYGPSTMLVLIDRPRHACVHAGSRDGFVRAHAARHDGACGRRRNSRSTCRTSATGKRRCRTTCATCSRARTGPRGKNFNMRWIASMVADVHRILTRGGIFIYPWDKKDPTKVGKLRLMYEANPMSYLVEQAGGAATNGRTRILDLAADGIAPARAGVPRFARRSRQGHRIPPRARREGADRGVSRQRSSHCTRRRRTSSMKRMKSTGFCR